MQVSNRFSGVGGRRPPHARTRHKWIKAVDTLHGRERESTQRYMAHGHPRSAAIFRSTFYRQHHRKCESICWQASVRASITPQLCVRPCISRRGTSKRQLAPCSSSWQMSLQLQIKRAWHSDQGASETANTSQAACNCVQQQQNTDAASNKMMRGTRPHAGQFITSYGTLRKGPHPGGTANQYHRATHEYSSFKVSGLCVMHACVAAR